MKKNLMSVIILAMVFANFVLTAILMFSVLPETQKVNKMVEAVCGAINLELNSGAGASNLTVPIENIENYSVKDGASLNVNLKKSEGDSKTHYAVLTVSVSMNTKSDGYKKYGGAAGLKAQDSIICNDINEIVGKYTMEEFNSNTKEIQEEIKKRLQGYFGADFVIGVSFSQKTTN